MSLTEELKRDNLIGLTAAVSSGRHRSTRKLFATISGLAAIFAFACTGCQSYHGETLPNASGQQPGLLAPGDTIKISFTTAPELNQSERIEASGRVTLPLVGDIYAAGKTTGQLQTELTQLYKTQLQNSDVIVTLDHAGGRPAP